MAASTTSRRDADTSLKKKVRKRIASGWMNDCGPAFVSQRLIRLIPACFFVVRFAVIRVSPGCALSFLSRDGGGDLPRVQVQDAAVLPSDRQGGTMRRLRSALRKGAWTAGSEIQTILQCDQADPCFSFFPSRPLTHRVFESSLCVFSVFRSSSARVREHGRQPHDQTAAGSVRLCVSDR